MSEKTQATTGPTQDAKKKYPVNLPKTDFPMKGNLSQLEPRMLAWWEEKQTYARLLQQLEGKKPFLFHDGPPYANGHMHMGHALNKVLKDFVVKYRCMSGQPTDFIPGWDTHGLPIEQAVEKRLRDRKIDKRTMDREAFLEACRAYATEFIGIQAAEQQRLGLFARYERPYRTLEPAYEAQEIRELAVFAGRGMLYRKKKPVYWDPWDQTALAEAEVEYAQLEVPSAFVGFPLDAASQAKLAAQVPAVAGRQVELLIWTTTPWTLPANLAVSVHPEFEYVLYALGERTVLVAKELLAKVLADLGGEELEVKEVEVAGTPLKTAALVDPARILGYVVGASLEKLTYVHPLLEDATARPVVLGDHVTLEAGTGLVHTAPGHGPDDYLVGLRYGLEPYSPVNAFGAYEALPPLEALGLAGLNVWKANPKVMELLAEKGALFGDPTATLSTSYPHGWRSHKPLLFRATHQWFIPLDQEETALRKAGLEQIDQVNWVPSWGKHRITGMLENRPDWCISRQRTWGVPIPVALCQTEGCHGAHVSKEMMLKVADVVAEHGIGAWYARPVTDFLPSADTACEGCGKRDWARETDILDVWFDSACSFSAVMERHFGEGPVDLYLEGSDQHRGWFHSSLLVSTATRGRAPYRTCLTHGFVVDDRGEKMSKSKGNVVAPEKIVAQYGAEVLRLWVAATDYRNDVRLGDVILKGLAEGYRKIRNTLRYALSNLYDFDPALHRVPTEALEPLDRWARARLASLVERTRQAYEAYEFHLVYSAVVDFCAGDLSAIYFDILKDRLYTSRTDGASRRSAQTVLLEIAETLVRLLAPVMSFTAEEAWQHLPGSREESVFFAGMPAADVGAQDAELVARYDRLFEIRSALQQQLLEPARREKRIGASLEAKVVLSGSGSWRSLLAAHRDELPALFIVSQVELVDAAAPDAVALEVIAEDGAGVKASQAKADGEKCPRCWTYSTVIDADHEVCAKCDVALAA